MVIGTDFLLSDPLNCEILASSLELQRQISEADVSESPQVGAQQAMPKPEDSGHFGPENPLPWVPDLVGCEFSSDNPSVLVVGSSYNGFIEGYSQRSIKLEDYLAVRDLVREGNEDPKNPKVQEACAKFVRAYETHIVSPDIATYYGPILTNLLGKAGITQRRACLTDLCKASFVKRGSNVSPAVRGDEGSDRVVRENWPEWVKFVTCKVEPGLSPLPYQWIWKRMQQCQLVVALGTIAEYGLLKIFASMAGAPSIKTQQSCKMSLDKSLDPSLPWTYCYADSSRRIAHWLKDKNWYCLADPATGRSWRLLPTYHPAARPPHYDPLYTVTSLVLRDMISNLGQRLPTT